MKFGRYWSFFRKLRRNEDGAVVVWFAFVLPIAIGFATLSVDAPYLYETKNMLQVAADAAALAGDQSVGSYTGTVTKPCTAGTTIALCVRAKALAQANVPPSFGTVLLDSDIEVGFWDNTGKWNAYTG